MQKISLTVFITLLISTGSAAEAAIERNPVAIKDVAKVLALVCESKGLQRFGDWAIKKKVNKDKFSNPEMIVDLNRLNTKAVVLKVGSETITASKNTFAIGATSGSDTCDALMNYIDRKSTKFSIWNFLIENAYAQNSMELQQLASIAQGAAAAGVLNAAINGSNNKSAIVSGIAQLGEIAKRDGKTSFQNPSTDAAKIRDCGNANGVTSISAGPLTVELTKLDGKVTSVNVRQGSSVQVVPQLAKVLENNSLRACANRESADRLDEQIRGERKDAASVASNVLEQQSDDPGAKPEKADQ